MSDCASTIRIASPLPPLRKKIRHDRFEALEPRGYRATGENDLFRLCGLANVIIIRPALNRPRTPGSGTWTSLLVKLPVPLIKIVEKPGTAYVKLLPVRDQSLVPLTTEQSGAQELPNVADIRSPTSEKVSQPVFALVSSYATPFQLNARAVPWFAAVPVPPSGGAISASMVKKPLAVVPASGPAVAGTEKSYVTGAAWAASGPNAS